MRTKLILIISFLFVFLFSVNIVHAVAPVVSNLKTNGLSSPDNVTTVYPVFSWNYSGDNSQQEIHLQVGTSAGENNKWDTGEVSLSTQSLTYLGSALQADTTYYWRVTVYDGAEWSEWYVSQFKTAPSPTVSLSVENTDGYVNTRTLTLEVTSNYTATHMAYSIDNGSWSSWAVVSNELSLTLPSTSKTYSVTVRVKDSFGIMESDSVTVILDTLTPAVAASYPQSGVTISESTVDISVAIYDEHFDNAQIWISGVEYPLSATAASTFHTGSLTLSYGRQDILVQASDFAGNVTRYGYSFTISPTAPPTEPDIPTTVAASLVPVSFLVSGEPLSFSLHYSNPYTWMITEILSIQIDGEFINSFQIVAPPKMQIEQLVIIDSYPQKDNFIIQVLDRNGGVLTEYSAVLVPLMPQGTIDYVVIGLVVIIIVTLVSLLIYYLRQEPELVIKKE